MVSGLQIAPDCETVEGSGDLFVAAEPFSVQDLGLFCLESLNSSQD